MLQPSNLVLGKLMWKVATRAVVLVDNDGFEPELALAVAAARETDGNTELRDAFLQIMMEVAQETIAAEEGTAVAIPAGAPTPTDDRYPSDKE